MRNMTADIRIGKVSRVDHKAGKASVTYTDKGGIVTRLLPVAAIGGVYRMPEVEEYVLVLHLGTGPESGVVLGKFWSEKNKPPVYGKGRTHVELDSKAGAACCDYNDGTITLKADSITLSTSEGTRTVEQIIRDIEALKRRL